MSTGTNNFPRRQLGTIHFKLDFPAPVRWAPAQPAPGSTVPAGAAVLPGTDTQPALQPKHPLTTQPTPAGAPELAAEVPEVGAESQNL